MQHTFLSTFNDCERKAIDLELAAWVRTRTSLPNIMVPIYRKENTNDEKFKIQH